VTIFTVSLFEAMYESLNSCGLLACLEESNSSICTLLLFLNRQILLVCNVCMVLVS
jgi:hypothetical protein